MAERITQPIPLPTSSGLFGPNPGTSGYIDLSGMTLVETVGSSTVQIVIRRGSATGTPLLAISLAAGGADSKTLNHPIRSNAQLYAVVSGSGTPAGCAHIV